MPSDFYTDTAASVQESVGGGAIDIDVHDITAVVVDDECDINTSRIDKAQIDLDEQEHLEQNSNQSSKTPHESTSNIDEAVIVPKEAHVTDAKIPETNPPSIDNSRIDEAQLDLAEIESQIEPITAQNGSISPVVDSSKLDDVQIVSTKEKVTLSENAKEINCSPQLSGIDNAQVPDKEKGDVIIIDQSNNESRSSTLNVSRIDDADIQPKDVEVNIDALKDKPNLEQSNLIEDSSRLDLVVATSADQRDIKRDDVSIDVTREESVTSASRIDNANVESDQKPNSESETHEIDNSSDSRIDHIELPSNEAAITITSPSPSNDTSRIPSAMYAQNIHI